ncbi:NAD-dependent succinate-semialdehyde dehydrogenase [Stenotrophomonas sp.]|uniref:NAD-dependent succinate-semialdehyde dehydrogenase n=1 Tax=Stenotrophomonas sp. TaxID=69392 RepID=UPI00289F1EA8|nr:NAD-dependent succinate-semialdehyde dehydrogenase [Stenotrophomonas sp.]
MSAAPTTAISRDPATAQVIAEHPFASATELETILQRGQAGFAAWSGYTLEQRAGVLRAMAAVLRRDREPLAALATAEMGKVQAEALAEIEKCAVLCDWYAEHGAPFLRDEPTQVPGDQAYVSYLPLGVVLGIMPWNFPYWQVMRAAVPILMGGNGFLLKPAENIVGTALLLDAAWREAGLPEGTFIAANISREGTSAAIADDRIAAVTLTGSVAAGRSIAAQAGQALKKVVLELGGSDPFIVLADADLDAAVDAAVASRFQNTGQVCIAGKRIIVEEAVYDRFVAQFCQNVQALTVGDGREPGNRIGPMARQDLLDQLHAQVQASVDAGAQLRVGGHQLDRPGAFYAPTVLVDVEPGMQAFDTETFGPVASISRARNADHAVELANQSEFGLSGNLWSGDRARAMQLARRLQTGGVFVNGFSASDPRVPIGGVKKSGFGRELSHFGIREFVNAQTVWFDKR